MFAIIDIETTGLKASLEKITEIAIYIYDGNQVIDRFVSLINPERNIPYQITKITGISNQMVANAPKFYEIAKKILELTENKIFVAHNVQFDYGFIKEEFKRLGYNYQRKTICTVKLSRKLIPNLPSYSLGNLCQSLDIPILNRHRAAGDTEATVKLFEKLLKIDISQKPILSHLAATENGLHPDLKPETIENLPEKEGVYYFYNQYKKLIYIGKSINIKSRIKQHLANNSTPKAIEMKSKIVDIDYELTGNELIALLLESDEIKTHLPIYNRSQRRVNAHYGIFFHFDANDYLCFKLAKNDSKEIPLTSFSTLDAAKNHLERLTEKFKLCQKMNGLYNHSGSCFHYEIKQCKGACIGVESANDYNQRAEKALQTFEFENENFLVIGKGRSDEEKSVVRVANGKYIGFGYIDSNVVTNDLEILFDCIKARQNNRDVQVILKNYIESHDVEKIIIKD